MARRRSGAFWFAAGVAGGIGISITKRRHARQGLGPRPSPPLLAGAWAQTTVGSQKIRARRRRRIALIGVELLALGALGAALAAFVASDTRAVAPATAQAAGTATVRRMEKPLRPPTSAAPTSQTRSSHVPAKPSSRSKEATAPPSSRSKDASPERTTGFVPARTFVWPRVPSATGYVIRFYLNQRVVIERWVGHPRFSVPSSFRFTPGKYRWQVLPYVQGRYQAPVVDSRFSVTG